MLAGAPTFAAAPHRKANKGVLKSHQQKQQKLTAKEHTAS